jgi:hypothetical protein
MLDGALFIRFIRPSYISSKLILFWRYLRQIALLHLATQEKSIMGGQNHQPCNRPQTNYLRLSTKMSRDLSVARAYFEQANIALEDVLLQELAGQGGGSVKHIIEQLSDSKAALAEMMKTIGLLRADMHSHAFEDLPTLQFVPRPHAGGVLRVNFSSLLLISKFQETKTFRLRESFCLARGQGLEPRLLGPEPSVLPLDDPRMILRSESYTKTALSSSIYVILCAWPRHC